MASQTEPVRRTNVAGDPPGTDGAIGARLRSARVEAGFTQAQLAGERYTRAYVRETVAENKALRLSGASCDEVVRKLEPVLRQLTPNPRPKVTGVKVADDRANARLDIETHFGPAATKVFLVHDDARWKIDHDADYPDGPATRLD